MWICFFQYSLYQFRFIFSLFLSKISEPVLGKPCSVYVVCMIMMSSKFIFFRNMTVGHSPTSSPILELFTCYCVIFSHYFKNKYALRVSFVYVRISDIGLRWNKRPTLIASQCDSLSASGIKSVLNKPTINITESRCFSGGLMS